MAPGLGISLIAGAAAGDNFRRLTSCHSRHSDSMDISRHEFSCFRLMPRAFMCPVREATAAAIDSSSMVVLTWALAVRRVAVTNAQVPALRRSRVTLV